MSDDIRIRALRVLAEQLGDSLNVDEVGDATKLFGRGIGLNSLDSVSLIIRLEDEFEVFFEADEMSAGLESFGNLIELVRSKLGS